MIQTKDLIKQYKNKFAKLYTYSGAGTGTAIALFLL